MEIDHHGVQLKRSPDDTNSNSTKGEEIPLAIKL